MSDTVVTAQPEATPAPAANSAPAEQITSTAPAGTPPGELPKLSLDEILSKRYDEMQATPAPEKTPAEVAPVKSDQPAVAASEPAQSSPAIGPPNSWSAEHHETWTKLPPEAQRYIADRESQVHSKISQQGNELRSFEPISQIYEYARHIGVPKGQEAELVRNWAGADAFLRQSPQEAIKWLASNYGVDLAQLTGQPPASKPNGQAGEPSVDDLFKDPRVDQLNPVVQQLKQQVEEQARYIRSIGGHVSARDRAEAEQRLLSANETIAAFAQGKTDWADLEDDVIREVKIAREVEPNGSMQKWLETAYERARWANPNVRQRILDQERKAEADKAQKEMAARQAEAKKHAAINARTGAPAEASPVGKSWDDETALSEIYDRAISR